MAEGVIAAHGSPNYARSWRPNRGTGGAGGRDVADFRHAISQRCLSPRAATQKMEPQIIQPADHRNPPPEGSYFGRNGQN
jgi:hypothetical protein